MSAGPRIRVLVVEGDVTMRQGLLRTLGQHAMIEVVGGALSGRTAIPKVASYQPDCVVVDLESNTSEGLELLAHLREVGGATNSIVVASASVPAEVLQRAAQLGAAEVVQRLAGDGSETMVAKLAQDLIVPMLRLAKPSATSRSAISAVSPLPSVAVSAAAVGVAPAAIGNATAPKHGGASANRLQVVGIGVSTGGPKALAVMLPRLPADFPLPILLVQHMPPKFTASLAESLDRTCKLRVHEAKDGDRVERGRILIAPGGLHMRVSPSASGQVVRLAEDPPECSCRPSVDYLFRSLVGAYGGHVLGVVLTGMGEDGWLGAKCIHNAGGRVLAQNEASSTVFGMPRGPIDAGIATAVDLDCMADNIVQLVKGALCS